MSAGQSSDHDVSRSLLAQLGIFGIDSSAAGPSFKGPYNINVDTVDQSMFTALTKGNPELQKLISSGPPQFGTMLEDLFGIYYKRAPDLVPTMSVLKPNLVVRPIVERLLTDQAVQNARQTTVMNEAESAAAVLTAGKVLAEEMKARDLNDPLCKHRPDKSGQQTPSPSAPLTPEEEQALHEYDGKAAGLGRAVRKATETAEEETATIEAALSGWGFGSEDLAYMDPAERLKFVQRLLTPSMQAFAAMIGKMRNFSRAAQKSRTVFPRAEIHGIELGDDLTRVLPSELVMLLDPDLELDFLKRFAEGSLLQYEMKPKEKLGKGPKIICIDRSGSMDGKPLLWAIGLAMGVVDAAYRDNCPAYVIVFDHEIVAELEFVKRGNPVENLMKLASVEAGGGTAYEPPLTRTLELVQGSKYGRADLVFITDGICGLSDEFLTNFNQVRKQKELRVHTILIGYTEADALMSFSDKVYAVQGVEDEAADEVAGTIFAEVVS